VVVAGEPVEELSGTGHVLELVGITARDDVVDEISTEECLVVLVNVVISANQHQLVGVLAA